MRNHADRGGATLAGTVERNDFQVRFAVHAFQVVFSLLCLVIFCCSHDLSSQNQGEKLQMYGKWKIVKYVFGDGMFSMDEQKAQAWIGKVATYSPKVAMFDEYRCQSPFYKVSVENADDYLEAQFRTNPKSIGITQERVEIIEVYCGHEDNSWIAPGSLFIKLETKKALTVWNGVFFLLEKLPEKN